MNAEQNFSEYNATYCNSPIELRERIIAHLCAAHEPPVKFFFGTLKHLVARDPDNPPDDRILLDALKSMIESDEIIILQDDLQLAADEIKMILKGGFEIFPRTLAVFYYRLATESTESCSAF